MRHLDWHTAKVTPAFKDAEKKVKAKPRKPSRWWMALGSTVEMDEKVLEHFGREAFSSFAPKELGLLGNRVDPKMAILKRYMINKTMIFRTTGFWDD